MRVEDVVDIQQWLEVDARLTAESARLERDQRIAATLDAAQPLPRLAQWWRSARGIALHAAPLAPFAAPLAPRHAASAGHDVASAIRLTHALLAACGLLAGTGAASAVFRFDGSTPINVLLVLAAFVFAPLLFVAASLLLLPGTRLLQPLQRLLAACNVGHLAATLAERLRRARGGVPLPLWRPAQAPGLSRVGRWQFLAFAQTAALAFNTAALATASALVVFTDLAFGWRTTLAVTAADIEHVARAISLPWAALLPGAVPAPGVITATRDFRLGSGELDAVLATAWWPFLLCAMAVYGVLPRCLLALLCAWRLHVARGQLLLAHPEVADLLARLAAPPLARGVAGREPARQAHVPATGTPPPAGSACVVLTWADALPAEAGDARVRAAGFVPARHERAGHADLDADRAALATLAAAPAELRSVVVLCKGYEPPTLELLDFVAATASASPARTVVLLPVDGESPAAADAARVWRDAVARAADIAGGARNIVLAGPGA
jgi:hypothetical protein